MRYRTIVADPPWEPTDKRGGGLRFQQDGWERVPLVYPTMTLDEIGALDVAALSEDDAHLFVWTTQRHLEVTPGIVRGWGFSPSCTLAWCKEPHGWGPGGVFQSTLEFIVYARRGTPQPSTHTIVSQWFRWPRGQHSAKPEAFLDLVEAHFPAPRLEMFARRQRLGWDTWGNEALKHVDLAQDPLTVENISLFSFSRYLQGFRHSLLPYRCLVAQQRNAEGVHG